MWEGRVLGQNCLHYFGIKRYFRITLTITEDNLISKIYGKHRWMQVMLICNLVCDLLR